MISFRSKAPEAQKIMRLEYPSHTEEVMGQGTKLILFPAVKNEVVQCIFYWPFGSQNQNRPYQAKSSLSLCLNGTTLNTAEQIQNRFDFWGTSLNPTPGLLHSDIAIKSTKEYFKPALEWFINNFRDASYPNSEIETFKQTSVAALQRKMTTPKYWAYKESMELLYGQNSVMTRFVTPNDILGVNQEEMVAFHGQNLRLENAVCFLSGDYGTEEIDHLRALLSETVSAAPKQSLDYPYSDEKSDVAEKMHKVENTSQVSLFMAKSLPPLSETEIHSFSLLNLLLGGFFGSRLMQEIREEKGLTYGIGSYIMQTHNGNVWCISGEMNSQNAGLALDESRNILRSFVNNPPAGDELERAKRYYAGQLRASFDGPFSMAHKLKGLMIRGYTLKHLDTAMNALWSCSTDELCTLADNYLKPDSFKTVLAGDI